jgi:predicted alternative tryptophan synthase beta-subunit
MALIEQEVSQQQYIDIPGEVMSEPNPIAVVTDVIITGTVKIRMVYRTASFSS